MFTDTIHRIAKLVESDITFQEMLARMLNNGTKIVKLYEDMMFSYMNIYYPIMYLSEGLSDEENSKITDEQRELIGIVRDTIDKEGTNIPMFLHTQISKYDPQVTPLKYGGDASYPGNAQDAINKLVTSYSERNYKDFVNIGRELINEISNIPWTGDNSKSEFVNQLTNIIEEANNAIYSALVTFRDYYVEYNKRNR